MNSELADELIDLCKKGFDKTAITKLVFENDKLENLLDECIRVLEQNHTSSHPSARALITTMSPTFRDWRGARLTSQVKKANVVDPTWRD